MPGGKQSYEKATAHTEDGARDDDNLVVVCEPGAVVPVRVPKGVLPVSALSAKGLTSWQLRLCSVAMGGGMVGTCGAVLCGKAVGGPFEDCGLRGGVS